MALGDALLLFIDAAQGEKQIWRSDGTAQGSFRLDGLPEITTFLDTPPVAADSYVAFATDDGQGVRIYGSDGTPEGTVVLLQREPGDMPVGTMTAAGDSLLINTWDLDGEPLLFYSDGTPAGTRPLKRLSLTIDAYGRHQAVSMGGALFFFASSAEGLALWRSDGTAAGTARLYAFPGAPQQSGSLAVSGGRLFFTGPSPLAGLWVSDGTAAGTRLVVDAGPAGGEAMFALSPFGPGVIFLGSTAGAGAEPWVSDGTAAGTRMLRDIAAGPSSSTYGDRFVVHGGAAFFLAQDHTHGGEIWRSDGTPAGTHMLLDALSGSAPSNPHGFVEAGGQVYLVTLPPGGPFYGIEGDLWATDGTPAGTRLLRQGAITSIPQPTPVAVGERIFFVSGDPATGLELWLSDGTTEGTRLVRDIVPGPESAGPQHLRPHGDGLFFIAPGEPTYDWLWYSDGTTDGTRPLARVSASYGPPTLSVAPAPLLWQGAAYIASGGTLWRSDGTAEGTAVVHSVDGALQLMASDDSLWFGVTSSEASSDIGLWRSDGTPGGTVQLLNPGGSQGGYRLLGTPAGRAVIVEEAGYNSMRLYSSDGTPAGTTILRGFGKHEMGVSAALDNAVLFEAEGALWRSDGTAEGTFLLRELDMGEQEGRMARLGDAALFTADDGASGAELWRSDGTAAGTFLLRDLWPGISSSYISQMTPLSDGSALAFIASDLDHGAQIWQTDGTAAGTALVGGAPLGPGVIVSSGSELLVTARGLFFSGGDGRSGDEPWLLPIGPQAQPPRAEQMVLTGAADTAIAGELPPASTQSGPPTYSILRNGERGNAAIGDPATGSFTYTPLPGARGSDSFTYEVSDGAGAFARATITVIILAPPLGDTPAAVIFLPALSR